MTETTKRIIHANGAYAREFARRAALPRRPSLGLAVVTCMDARINVNEALGLADGEAHIIRNAGGLVTDDVLRSLVLSQWALGTEEIVVIQHTNCGLYGLDEQALADRVSEESGATPPFRFGAFTDLEWSIRGSVDQLRSCTALRSRDNVSGFLFDVDTGVLRPVQ